MPMITPVLFAIADIIALRGKTLLSLEISTFVRKYPDIYNDLLTSIVMIREDINRTEAKYSCCFFKLLIKKLYIIF